MDTQEARQCPDCKGTGHRCYSCGVSVHRNARHTHPRGHHQPAPDVKTCELCHGAGLVRAADIRRLPLFGGSRKAAAK
jgi:DnaJ-class molecular chaperone